MISQSADQLPVNFPGRANLVAAGLDTVQKVRDHADLNTIPGLDAGLVAEIKRVLTAPQAQTPPKTTMPKTGN